MFLRLILMVAIVAVATSLGGCLGGSIVYKDSQAVQQKLDLPYATLYILREALHVSKGASDEAVRIDINGHEVVKLVQGEYAMLRIKPTEGTIRIKSYSIVGNNPVTREMSGEETFNFAAGQTNFINVRRIDGEFRGVYFIPERIEFNKARKLAEKLRPAGDAKEHRIDAL
jgi:hypothetical protein